MNAITGMIKKHFTDAAAAADLTRCNGMVATARADVASPIADSVRNYIAAKLDTTPDEAEDPFIDYEAIAWAYQKLLAYGVGNGSMNNAMMLDRLNLMLLTAEVAG